MAQTKEEKKIIVEELAKKIKSAKSVVFSDFKGLVMKDMMALRKGLKKEGAELKVAKKTLINKALEKAGIKINTREMDGQLALAISEQDEVIAAKLIAKTSKDNENLKILGGILNAQKMSAEEIESLAKLPSKEELLAKLVGSINAPVSGLVNVMAGNIRGLVQTLKAISEK